MAAVTAPAASSGRRVARDAIDGRIVELDGLGGDDDDGAGRVQ